MVDVTPQQVLKVVEASPEMVAAHDKKGWLALFSRDAVVEDPVGSAPNRKGRGIGKGGEDELGRFYDTFIGPNEIRFEVLGDYIAGLEVARDVRIHTKLSTGFSIVVPAHLLYELTEEDGELRVRRLAAHWELPKLSKQALTGGFAGFRTMNALSWRMLGIQGVGGVLGYSKGMVNGIGRRGSRAVEVFSDAVNRGDVERLASLFEETGEAMEYPVGRVIDPETLLTALPGRLVIDEVITAGWVASFRYDIEGDEPAPSKGLAFLYFGQRSKKIVRARFFSCSLRLFSR